MTTPDNLPPLPADLYVYEWDTVFGVHRSLYAGRYHGAECDRALSMVTVEKAQAYAQAAIAAERGRQPPLTEEQIMAIAFGERFKSGADYLIALARAIESAHAIHPAPQHHSPSMSRSASRWWTQLRTMAAGTPPEESTPHAFRSLRGRYSLRLRSRTTSSCAA